MRRRALAIFLAAFSCLALGQQQYPMIDKGKAVYGKGYQSPPLQRLNVSSTLTEKEFQERCVIDTRPTRKCVEAPLPPITPKCPRFDLRGERDDRTAVLVNGETIGHLKKFRSSDGQEAKAVTWMPKVPDDPAAPCGRKRPVPFYTDVLNKKMYVGEESVGTFETFEPDVGFLKKYQSTNNGDGMPLGAKEGLVVAVYETRVTEASDKNPPAEKKQPPSDKPVRDRVINTLIGGGRAAGGFLGVFFTPSRIGCGPGELC